MALITFSTVKSNTGFAGSFLYKEMAEGRFPKPVKIGAKASRWVSTEVDQWIADHIAVRDAAQV